MPRSKREGRGSRSAVPISGATVGLFPSGVTLSQTGLQHSGGVLTTTQMGYLDDLTGYVIEHPTAANYMASGGSQAWGGVSILISTGLSSVISFIASLNIDGGGGASPCATQWVNHPTGGNVTAALVTQDPTAGAVAVVVSGGTMTWVAFGT